MHHANESRTLFCQRRREIKMAGIDWGIIALKNHKLIPESKYDIIQGAAGHAKIENTIFDRNCALNGVSFQQINTCEAFTDESFYLNFDNELYLKNKYAIYWNHNGIQFKTKRIAESIYLTNFNYNNDFYQILQGYDISLNSCYSKQVIKLIKKFVPEAKLKIVK